MTFMPPVFREPRRRWRGSVMQMAVGDGTLGLALGALLATGALLFDVMGLRTYFWASHFAVMNSLLFIGAGALTLGGLVVASAAMAAGRDDDDEPRGGRRALARVAVSRRMR